MQNLLLNKTAAAITFSWLLIPIISFAGPEEGRVKTYIINDSNKTVIGSVIKLLYEGEETLADIAIRYGIGYAEISDANWGLDPEGPARGKELIIPTQWVLPEIMEKGILVNLAELRLYYFENNDKDGKYVTTFPIGIGRSGFSTPTGDFEVTLKIKDPEWYPPKTSREANKDLPFVVPAGPDNPLGSRWIQLSLKGYGIHGTKVPSSIGKKISLGCIRLINEDVEWLYERAYEGMPVKIINMPVKIGWIGGSSYIEVHRNGMSFKELEEEVWRKAKELGVDQDKPARLDMAAGQALGVPLLLTESIAKAGAVSTPVTIDKIISP